MLTACKYLSIKKQKPVVMANNNLVPEACTFLDKIDVKE